MRPDSLLLSRVTFVSVASVSFVNAMIISMIIEEESLILVNVVDVSDLKRHIK